MELSRPFSDRAPTPARYAGVGLVVVLHLAGIYALSAGLITPPARLQPPPDVLVLPPEPPAVEPPVQPFTPERPTLPMLTPIQVPVPDIVVAPAETPTVTAVPWTGDSAPPTTVPAAQAAAPTAPAMTEAPRIHAAGAVCAVMPRPDVPAVAWSGEAVLQALATVKGGRVVAQDVRVVQGALDPRTRRALQRSVEAALAGYQCQGDAVFQQDFAFRLD